MKYPQQIRDVGGEREKEKENSQTYGYHSFLIKEWLVSLKVNNTVKFPTGFVVFSHVRVSHRISLAILFWKLLGALRTVHTENWVEKKSGTCKEIPLSVGGGSVGGVGLFYSLISQRDTYTGFYELSVMYTLKIPASRKF